MIEIKKPSAEKFDGKCYRCRCEFSYQLDDLILENSIKCPGCGKIFPHFGYKNDKNSIATFK